MASQIEFEQRQSAMLSKKGADIRKAFKEQTEELYNDKNIADNYRDACSKWDITITTCCYSMDLIQYLHMFVEMAFMRQINLDRCSKWRMLMRSTLPVQLMMKMNNMTTQIPKMSMIDKTEFTKRGSEKSVALFRKF